MLLHSTAATGSSTRSSRSDISDTETLFTSDFASTPHTSITGGSAKRGNRFTSDIFDSEFAMDTTPTLARSRSMIALNQLGSSNLLPQNGLLGRVKSFPALRPGGDKHVRFTASHEEDQESLLYGDGLNESSKDFNGDTRSFQSKGMASGTSLHESDPLNGSASSYDPGIGAIQPREIYVPYDQLCKRKQFQASTSLQEAGGSSSNHGTTNSKQDLSLVSNGSLESSHGASNPPLHNKNRPQSLLFTTSPPTGKFANEGEGSLTASANGEIMGVSALNSEVSTDCPPLDASSNANHPIIKGNTRTKPNKKLNHSFSPNKKTPTEGDGSPVSLPDLSHQSGSLVRFDGDTTGSVNAAPRPSTGYFHQFPQSSIKSLPLLRHFSKKSHSRVPLFPDELHGSSVFSSTRYGPIVSAAQSMTLSYTGSEQEDTETSASPSAVSIPHQTSQW